MTHYEKLGIAQNATQAEIKDAYKNLVKKYHPDVYQGDKAYAEKMTKEINIAYDILSNPTKKAEYDEELNPTTYTYTPPTYNYDYTPPKYDTPPTDYNTYRKTYGREYNYNYRYTNYHRNKTPNSNYSENSPLENKIIKIFDTNRLVVIFLILIIYAVLLVFTFCQFYAFKNNKYTGTITNPQKNDERNITNIISQGAPSIEENNTFFPSSYEDFDINYYISDSELYSIYSQYFYGQYESFSEFKEYLSRELYDYYSELY